LRKRWGDRPLKLLCDSRKINNKILKSLRNSNIDLVKKLENLKYLLRKNIQPRLAWEIAFLKISMEDI